MSRVFLAAAAAAATAGPGFAQDAEGLKAAFGNTIVSTYPDGRTAELWLRPDGVYDAEGRRHGRSNGHWTIKGDKVCLRQSHPLSLPFTYCAQIMQGGIGTSWTGKAITGEPIQLRLERGVVDPAGEGQSAGAG